ncbi:hypothetical protein DRN86_01755 [Candidatus Geothermarchaeota archaeon]|nr:MAG: hypothetical protein DRN86_01755 [Candidatus Geothermarchaeota archaeon]
MSKILEITIDKVYRRSMFRILVGSTLAEAVREMKRKNTEELIVTDEEGKGLGFIDSRDIVRLIAEGKANPDEKVEDVMSTPLVTIKLNDTIAKACGIMLEKGIHHLVVVDDEGHVRGVLSDLDILKAIAFNLVP